MTSFTKINSSQTGNCVMKSAARLVPGTRVKTFVMNVCRVFYLSWKATQGGKSGMLLPV